MYHGYKNKGGGYWKGRTSYGKHYTSPIPPYKYLRNSSKKGETGSGTGFLIYIFVLLIIFLLIILK
jgi:hypothetical protein